jgi:ATP-binding cassette subfamily C (CFTR/MRP) protein 1
VYSKKNLLLLDDCFSGLDPTTEDRVMIRLFGRDGLFRRHSVTVVLVTHAANRWSYADHIVVLNAHGQLVEQGRFQHLMNNGKYLPAVAHKFSKERDIDRTAEVQASPGRPDTRGAGKDGSIADTDHSRSAGDWSTYIHYFRSCGWMNSICFICGLCSFAVFMRMPGETHISARA